ncbi:ABC transporter ATP-binding protein [Phycicoccus sp. MAQZ13P-2]|uniref:ABC transporter ATP-binding protein n=1 Tax=Phycicoccus mangrovi TaxID=2840470 RepID=UPI001C0042C7|nr:ABC transporter ATP-binding protein [Phycicoccus mangrovi]MBT9254458.1 ABC transporter ATP-binding protein [Phycicoccus mangrovi]MBT9272836.1 ABC transporter ATP-binding protein [Phycicoccus mangrovi]
MTALRLTGITASHPRTPVLHGIDLTVASGTTTAVLGPSGCGKTTLLRVVAGFMRPDAGEVRIGDELVAGPGTWVPPEKRGFGYVAQEGNLFPHLDVAANLSYGLPRRERRARERVAELLELVGLPAETASRRPDQLSGGQQQRVALARALARRPRVVLLDEPFSALDPELRATTREAVADALAHEGATVVLVTHDQAEALSFADEVAVMHEGRLSQVGAPSLVYSSPADRRSALSLGEACFLPGVLEAGVVHCALGDLPADRRAAAGPVEVMIRPEQLRLADARTGAVAPTGEVRHVAYFGHDALVEVHLDTADVLVRARTSHTPPPPVGSRVEVTVDGRPHLLAAGSTPGIG